MALVPTVAASLQTTPALVSVSQVTTSGVNTLLFHLEPVPVADCSKSSEPVIYSSLRHQDAHLSYT
jgi:hypothetical protein